MLAAAVSLFNVLVLPYARAYHQYAAPALWAGFAAAFAGFAFLGRRLRAADEARLARIRNIAVPVYGVVFFALQVLMGYLLEYVPAGDNMMIFNGSELLAAEGSFESEPGYGLYLARFSNQWGFLIFFVFLRKLFAALGIEAVFTAASVLQAALYALGVRAALRVVRRLGGVRGELMLLAMLACCLPMTTAAAVLYTDTFSLPFVLIALDLAMRIAEERSFGRQALLAAGLGLTALFGGQIKMTVYILVIAAVICWLLTMKPARAAACIALCVVIPAAGVSGFRRGMLDTVIAPEVYAQQNTPMIHCVMMSIPHARSPYGTATGDYGPTWELTDAGASREAVMDSIYTRMKDRIYTLRYPDRLIAAALRKNSVFMGDGTFGMTEMLDDTPVRENAVSAFVLQGRPQYPLYQSLCTGVFMAQLLLAACGCVCDIRRKDTRAALLYVAAFGAMLFLMLWEPRSRYIFGYVPVFLILAAKAAADGTAKQN